MHELEIDKVTGKVPMAYYGQLPWHGLGQEVSADRPMTAKEAISLGGLGWEVRKYPAYAKIGDTYVCIPDTYSVVREDSVMKEGVEPIVLTCGGRTVGPQYVPLQNVEAFSFFDHLVGEGKAIYHTVGALRQGDRIWILAKMPDDRIVLGSKDEIQPYVLLTNSHDGTSSIDVMLTMVRVVCANTLRIAMNNNWRRIKIRHTSSAGHRLKAASELMGVVKADIGRTQQIFESMATKPFTEGAASQYFKEVYNMLEKPDEPLTKRQETLQSKRLDTLRGIFMRGSGADLETTRGTLFGAFNAVTDYVDHYGRKSEPSTRMESVLAGAGDTVKQRAFDRAVSIL